MFSQRTVRVVVGLMTAACVIAGRAQAQSATEIVQAIETQYANSRGLSNITIAVAGAVVTLAGEAPSLHARGEAIDIARRMGGVESVVNDVSIPPAKSDRAIAEAMVNALRRYPHITIWDHVDGIVNDGKVRLEGMVTPDRNKPQEIGLEVAKVPGVQEIDINIQVMSPSESDRRIRGAIGRRLISRGDPFERFESMVNPPIRILVNNGIVVLLGYLGFQGDKIELERIVRQTQGVLRVENHVVVTN